jgi:HSP20 family protein
MDRAGLAKQGGLTMDDQQQRGAHSPSSPQPGAQMQQQGGASPQPGSTQPRGGQQEQFSAATGQQGGSPGGTTPGAGAGAGAPQGSAQGGTTPGAGAPLGGAGGAGGDDTGRRGGNPYSDFFSRRGVSPLELLKRLDEDVDRLFHEFVGGGRDLLRNRLRGWGGAGDTGDATAAASGAGSSGGSDGAVTEAAGGTGAGASAMATASGWLPQVEVFERNGKLHVHADLPGLSRENLQIGFEDGQLVLQGERRSTQTTTQPGGYYRTERSYGNFRRVIPLPEGVNPDTAQAGFHNGVLEVCFDMPVRHTRTRQIPIQEGHPTASPATGGAGAGSEVGLPP